MDGKHQHVVAVRNTAMCTRDGSIHIGRMRLLQHVGAGLEHNNSGAQDGKEGAHGNQAARDMVIDPDGFLAAGHSELRHMHVSTVRTYRTGRCRIQMAKEVQTKVGKLSTRGKSYKAYGFKYLRLSGAAVHHGRDGVDDHGAEQRPEEGNNGPEVGEHNGRARCRGFAGSPSVAPRGGCVGKKKGATGKGSERDHRRRGSRRQWSPWFAGWGPCCR